MKKRLLLSITLVMLIISAFSSIVFAQDGGFYYDPNAEPEALLETLFPSCFYVRPDVYPNNVLQVAELEGFNIFAQAVRAAGAEDLLTTEDGFTVLAPTDAAFEALPDGVLEDLLANPGELRQVILHHIIQDPYLANELPLGSVRTSLGKNVTITSGPRIDNARVVIPDNTNPTNGIVHGIDAVLLPPVSIFTTRSRPEAEPQEFSEECNCSIQAIIAEQRLNDPNWVPYEDRIAALANATSTDEYTVKAGDTLAQIAYEYYGTGNIWEAIYNANTDILTNPRIIIAGQTLTIPLE